MFSSPILQMISRKFNGGKSIIAFAIVGLGVSVLSTMGLCSAPTPDKGGIAAPSPDLKGVKVTTRREGELTHFFVENEEYCEVTMTFDVDARNLRADKTLPYTAAFPPRQTSEAFTLAPVTPGAEWEYSYTNFYKLGSNLAQHDDNYFYQLPYAPGSTYRVTQAANGAFSHKGSNKYAIDWKMLEGTAVHAARGGTVVKIKDDSTKGGASMDYDRYNNFVLIRHDDGTLGHYCHLRKNGVRVKPGQIVHAGDLIAYSGNTGFSSGPHLHFCVFRTLNGKERESIPIRFRTTTGAGLSLVSGRKYTSPEATPVPVAQRARELVRQGGAG